MIIEPQNAKSHEPSLIEDVIPPHQEQYTDASREEVRHRSIGSLYQQYLRNSKFKIKALQKRRAVQRQKKMVQPAVQVIEPVKPLPNLRYSIVRPLQTLPSMGPDALKEGTTDIINNLGDLFGNTRQKTAGLFHRSTAALGQGKKWSAKQFDRAKHSLVIAWLALYHMLHSAGLKILPKRYTASRGLIIDWRARSLSRMKFAVPVLCALLIASAVLLPKNGNSPDNPNNNTPSSKSVPAASTPNNQDTSGDSSSQNTQPGASGAAAQAITSPITSGSSSSPSSSGSATTGSASGAAGGRGSGSTSPEPTPAPAPAPTPTPSPLPLPVLPPPPQLPAVPSVPSPNLLDTGGSLLH